MSFGDRPVNRLPLEDHQDELVEAVSEIIDLAGLEETQKGARTTTYGLVDKYLAEEGILVLYVIDARMPSLRSCQMLRAVLQHHKAAKTNITLTKADGLHKTEVTENLVERVCSLTKNLAGLSLFRAVFPSSTGSIRIQ